MRPITRGHLSQNFDRILGGIRERYLEEFGKAASIVGSFVAPAVGDYPARFPPAIIVAFPKN
jgi:hypothetical protein